jgi:hypothetical protein
VSFFVCECIGYFHDRVLQTFCLVWFQTRILLISASRVTRLQAWARGTKPAVVFCFHFPHFILWCQYLSSVNHADHLEVKYLLSLFNNFLSKFCSCPSFFSFLRLLLYCIVFLLCDLTSHSSFLPFNSLLRLSSSPPDFCNVDLLSLPTCSHLTSRFTPVWEMAEMPGVNTSSLLEVGRKLCCLCAYF